MARRLRSLRRLLADRAAVSAVEFALLAPVMTTDWMICLIVFLASIRHL